MLYGFVGLSHLGLTTAISLSSVGFQILGYDQNSNLISNLTNKKLPLYEPKLEDIFSNSNSINFTSEINELRNCDVVYIALDIKTNDKNESDLTHVLELTNLVIPIMKTGSALVVHSQVNPGFTRKLHLNMRKDIDLYYQVEVLIFGQAVDRVLKPERYMIGCDDPKAPLNKAYEKLLSYFNCPIMPMRYESAELAKISINLYLSASVTVTNTLAEISENIGADWSEISPVLRLDRRIGQYAYLEPGLGISGGNLERDLVSVLKMADQSGAEPSVVASFVKNSDYMKQWVLRKLHFEALSKIKNPKIGVLGLSYKKDTNSIKNSPAIELLKSITDFDLLAFDPEVKSLPSPLDKISLKESAEEVLAQSSILIIMTPWDQFKNIDIKNFKGFAIIDPYKIFSSSENKINELKINYLVRGKKS